MAARVAVIDYGMGNIGSICKMLRHVGAEPVVTADPVELAAADRLVLPGVGHFDRAMANLGSAGLVEVLTDLVEGRRKPILGICLGMQLMCRSSEEGERPGLGFMDATVRRFDLPRDMGLKVPHMGWARLEVARASPMLQDLGEEARFYFVHSYYVDCAQPADVIARARHGHAFAAAFERGAVMGVQFHPEKSHRFGVQLFRNFVGEP